MYVCMYVCTYLFIYNYVFSTRIAAVDLMVEKKVEFDLIPPLHIEGIKLYSKTINKVWFWVVGF